MQPHNVAGPPYAPPSETLATPWHEWLSPIVVGAQVSTLASKRTLVGCTAAGADDLDPPGTASRCLHCTDTLPPMSAATNNVQQWRVGAAAHGGVWCCPPCYLGYVATRSRAVTPWVDVCAARVALIRAGVPPAATWHVAPPPTFAREYGGTLSYEQLRGTPTTADGTPVVVVQVPAMCVSDAAFVEYRTWAPVPTSSSVSPPHPPPMPHQPSADASGSASPCESTSLPDWVLHALRADAELTRRRRPCEPEPAIVQYLADTNEAAADV